MASNIEKVKEGLRNALKRAERTRKRTKSSEDRDFVALIQGAREVAVTLLSET